MTSSNEKELSFLEAVNELCLSQFIDSPTHKAGNILDLILTDSSNLDCWVDLNLFSDHYPNYFSLECTNKEIPFVPSYSQLSFDKSIFNQSLSPLYDLICFMQPSTVFDFVSEWYSQLSSSLFISIRQKRKRRRNFPIYYSSHTIHLMNQKDTNIRKMSRFWSFQLALRQREIDLSLSQSIELDKLVFLDSFNLSSSTECFRMLRKLGFCNHIPFPLLCITTTKNIALTVILQMPSTNTLVQCLVQKSTLSQHQKLKLYPLFLLMISKSHLLKWKHFC